MRRSLPFALVATLALAGPAVAGPAKPAKPTEAWASGQIESYDPSAKSIVLKQGSHHMTFVVADGAQLTVGKKTLAPDELSGDVGRHVKVRYTMSSGNRIADRLEIAEAPAASPAKK